MCTKNENISFFFNKLPDDSVVADDADADADFVDVDDGDDADDDADDEEAEAEEESSEVASFVAAVRSLSSPFAARNCEPWRSSTPNPNSCSSKRTDELLMKSSLPSSDSKSAVAAV